VLKGCARKRFRVFTNDFPPVDDCLRVVDFAFFTPGSTKVQQRRKQKTLISGQQRSTATDSPPVQHSL